LSGSRSFLACVALLVVMGAAESGFAAMQSTLVLLSAPERVRGGAMGILSACIGTQPLRTLAIGLLAASVGAPLAFGVNALAARLAPYGPLRRAGGLDLPQRGQQLLSVFHVAAERLDRLVDPASARVVRLRKVGGDLAEARAVLLDEAPVGGLLERAAVDERSDDAQGLVAHRRQEGLVDGRAAADQRDPGLQPRLLVLLEELQRRGAGDHRQDRVGVPADLRDVRREIHDAERGPELLDHLAA